MHLRIWGLNGWQGNPLTVKRTPDILRWQQHDGGFWSVSVILCFVLAAMLIGSLIYSTVHWHDASVNQMAVHEYVNKQIARNDRAIANKKWVDAAGLFDIMAGYIESNPDDLAVAKKFREQMTLAVQEAARRNPDRTEP